MEKYDVIIVGGSYAGLAAGMGLGRALRKVLIIDSGLPANRFTPQSHNFLTQDGRTPDEISLLAKQQVDLYKTVQRIEGLVVHAEMVGSEFKLTIKNGPAYRAAKLIFATGIVDLLPDISGFPECWGKSLLHCPYCHGYEVRNVPTGIFGNGAYAFEFGSLIYNWTSDLTIFTNGPSTLTRDQVSKLESHKVTIVEDTVDHLIHNRGYLKSIVFANGHKANVQALYIRPEFRQHCELPELLGCELTEDGYIKIDPLHRTTVPGIYACGDNVTRMRTVANSIAMGTTTAIAVNKDIIHGSF